MTFRNTIFWPELQPGQMPQHFNDYAQLLLAEGDSWFAWGEMRFLPSPSILTELRFERRTATLCYAYSGHTSHDMERMAVSSSFRQELCARQFSAILLSGGGNDLFQAIGEGHILKPAGSADGEDPASYVNLAALNALTDYVRRNFERILAWREQPLSRNRETPVLLHLYDYPTPRPAGAKVFGKPAVGPWLLPALQAVQAPPHLHEPIIRQVAQALMAMIRVLGATHENVRVIETAGTLDPAAPGHSADDADWMNEIHPNRGGYRKLARLFEGTLTELQIV